MNMSHLPAPSPLLLRTFLRPSASPCVRSPTRSTSTFMPRSRFAKIDRIDKLHRQQKADLRQEKADSRARALELAKQLEASGVAGTAHTLPFHIGRSKMNNLAIYEETKDGGVKHITIMQRLAGDLDALSTALREVLQLPEFTVDSKGRKKQTVAVNPLTNKIIIKGWRAPEVQTWAQTIGF